MTVSTMPESAQANDILSARADERLSHAYEQITRADEQLARLTEQLARMEEDAVRHPPTALRRTPSRGRPALRGFIGLLAAACIIGGAFAAQSSYGEAIRPTIAQWAAPYISSVSRLATAAPAPAAPEASSIRLAAAEAAAPLATSPVQTLSQETASSSPALPELAQLVQAIARDLTTVQQGIEELKAGQARIASDNARAAEQLKVSQDQVARLVAKTSEPDLRARAPAPPPRPLAEPARKPAPVQASSQARAQPMQLQPPQR